MTDCWLPFWAKSRGLDSRYPLLAHLIDTGAAASVLLNSQAGSRTATTLADLVGFESPGEAARYVSLTAALHDIGKATLSFQCLDRTWLGEAVASEIGLALATPAVTGLSHQQYSARIVQTYLQDADLATYVVGAHHGRFEARLRRRRSSQELATAAAGTGEGWDLERQKVLDLVRSVFGDLAPFPADGMPAAAASLVTAVVSVCDWLVSDLDWIRSRQVDIDSGLTPEEFFRQSRTAVGDRLDQIGLVPGPLGRRSFRESFQGWEPQGVQQVIDDLLPQLSTEGGIVVVMAPTGDGKTEAGLVAAGGLAEATGSRGLCFALPTTATADAMFARVSRFLPALGAENLPITLSHGMAALADDGHVGEGSSLEDEARRVATQWLSGRHRGLLGPVGVGTVDQVLLSALAIKFGFVRHFALVSKVLIVDEAHAYDPYMRALLARVLEWLGAYQVPVVLLSATLPRRYVAAYLSAYRRGREMDPGGSIDVGDKLSYPGVVAWSSEVGLTVLSSPSAGRDRVLKLSSVSFDDDSDRFQRAATEAVDLARGGKCVAVVCNTVAAAQAIYRLVVEQSGQDQIVHHLLHARLTLGARAQRTEQIVVGFGKDGPRPTAAVVVATQVIEQSLDLDFDIMLSELAPIAQLLQRAGRVKRHARPGRPESDPELRVLVPSGSMPSGWRRVYSEAELAKTVEVLAARSSLAIPREVQEVVDYVDEFFTIDKVDDSQQRAEDRRLVGEFHDRNAAERVAIPSPWAMTVGQLSSLTSPYDEDDIAATRLGDPSELVLLTVIASDGDGITMTLADGSTVSPKPRPSKATIRAILANAVTVTRYTKGWLDVILRSDGCRPMPEWSDVPWLGDLVVIEAVAEGDRLVLSAPEANRKITLDPILGLVEESTASSRSER